MRNECDPALALLAEYVGHTSSTLKTQAIFGLGLAYVGKYDKKYLNLLNLSINVFEVKKKKN